MKNEKNYLLKTVPTSDDWMIELENYALENQVPIMEPVSMNFLTQLIRMHKPANILEIGTAIGYSALRMHVVNPEAMITSIEKNKDMCHTARGNITKHAKTDKIKVVHADALEHMAHLVLAGERFDFIFIDAAKAQYKRFFLLAEKMLESKGVIICDNILFRGYVADQERVDNPRLQKLARKIDLFNQWLMEQTDYHSSIVPIGDGMTISIKKK